MIQATTEAHWHIRDDKSFYEDRLVEGRIVPFHERARVVEDGEVYWEEFDPGSLSAMCDDYRRRGNLGYVKFVLEHDESLPMRLGHTRSLEQREDGAWAVFRLANRPDLPMVREMLEESHTGLSVMFDDLRPPRVIDGVRHRVQVVIRHVAATPLPCYSGAQITSVREGEPELVVETPALDEWTAWLAQQSDATSTG